MGDDSERGDYVDGVWIQINKIVLGRYRFWRGRLPDRMALEQATWERDRAVAPLIRYKSDITDELCRVLGMSYMVACALRYRLLKRYYYDAYGVSSYTEKMRKDVSPASSYFNELEAVIKNYRPLKHYYGIRYTPEKIGYPFVKVYRSEKERDKVFEDYKPGKANSSIEKIDEWRYDYG